MTFRLSFSDFAFVVALAFTALATVIPVRANADDITVFAAASLKDALDEVVAAWQQRSDARVRVAYDGSSRLAQQIMHGAPADLYISANERWMDVLEKASRIEPATRRNLIENRLVLIAHGKLAQPVTITQGFDLAGLLGNNRLSMAMVEAVPAGIYGRTALTSLGVWAAVAPKVAQSDNVRAALALVQRGEAPYGIVYATDAVAARNVTVVGRFPPETHPRIVYPAAVVRGSANASAARGFLDFLTSAPAQGRFDHHGFKVIRPTADKPVGGAG
jgi:molybdate transport system substrate-binding protein